MSRPTVLERFWAKVEKTDDCWLWSGTLDRDGYGKFSVDGRTQAVHRWTYLNLVGPIPSGLTLDHVCHSRVAEECAARPGLCPHRRCVNPAHLEPVTHLENSRRGGKGLRIFGYAARPGGSAPLESCRRGHALTPDNVMRNGPNRTCRICRTNSARAWRARQAS